MESAARRTGPARERDRYRVIVRNDLQAALACFQLYFTPRGRAITKSRLAAFAKATASGEKPPLLVLSTLVRSAARTNTARSARPNQYAVAAKYTNTSALFAQRGK